jgi:hypothetical protein
MKIGTVLYAKLEFNTNLMRIFKKEQQNCTF